MHHPNTMVGLRSCPQREQSAQRANLGPSRGATRARPVDRVLTTRKRVAAKEVQRFSRWQALGFLAGRAFEWVGFRAQEATLFKTVHFQTDQPKGSVETRHVHGSIVETRYRGFCGEQHVQSVLDAMPRVMDAAPGTLWLVDLTELTDWDTHSRGPGHAIFQLFRARGGKRMAMVIKSPVLRMLVRTVAFAAALPISVFDTNAEALSALMAAAGPDAKQP